MHQELISIIVPVYKVEPFLEKCIDSVLSQTYKNFELILIDDGSPDSCGEICDMYAENDLRIKVVHKHNEGLSVARNVGLEMSTGTLIAFLDSDDTIEPTFLEDLYNILKEYDADISCCGVNFIGVDDSFIHKTYTYNIFELSYYEAMEDLLAEKNIRFEVWNKLYKKSVINDIRFKAGQIHEDVHFLTSILVNLKKVVYLDKPLHNYLARRPGNTNSQFKQNRMDIFKEFELLENRLIKNNMINLLPYLYKMVTIYSITFYCLARQSTLDDQTLPNQIYDIYKVYYKKLKQTKLKLHLKDLIKFYVFNLSPKFYSNLKLLLGKKI